MRQEASVTCTLRSEEILREQQQGPLQRRFHQPKPQLADNTNSNTISKVQLKDYWGFFKKKKQHITWYKV